MPVVTAVNSRALLQRQKPTGFLASFDYSINPYGGCVFACGGCYVPDLLHGLAESKGGWGNYVEARVRAVDVLRRQAHLLHGATFFMSPATDVYQPAEMTFRITRRLLEALRDIPFEWGLISTRSPLVLEDVDLIASFGDRLEVGITVPTDREDLRRRLDPRNPPVSARLQAARELKATGIAVRLHVAPVQPHTPDFPHVAAEVAHWVWMDHAAHLRVARPAFEEAGVPEALSRDWVLDQVAAWRDALGPERVGYGQEVFGQRWFSESSGAGAGCQVTSSCNRPAPPDE